MIRAIAAREREITEVRAPVLLKRCSLCFAPPSRMERPSTSRILPMIDPVIDALTTLVRPLESAMPAMINSAAFPKVAFSSPPSPSPTRAASSSVARPIQPATGTMAMAEQTKSAVGFERPGQKRRTNATGTKIRSQLSDGFMFRMLSVKVAPASSLRLLVRKLDARATMKSDTLMEETAHEIVRRLRAAGHVAYYAGGSVRDLLRGHIPKDVDVATDARP